MNQFLKQLGLLPTWQFGDVYGLDPDLLSMVPRPVCSVLLLFPVTEKYESYRLEEEAKIKSQGQEVSSEVYFMKQTISNACGTIGLIHAVANNQDRLEFGPGSALKKFLSESSSLSPEKKAKFLEEDESIRVTHESSAQEGQTENAAEVCKEFMARDPDELRFTVVALSKREPGRRSRLRQQREPGRRSRLRQQREPGRRSRLRQQREPGRRSRLRQQREPGRRSRLRQQREPGRRSRLRQQREPGRRSRLRQQREPGRRSRLRQQREPGRRSRLRQQREPGRRSRLRQQREPGRRSRLRQQREPGRRSRLRQQREPGRRSRLRQQRESGRRSCLRH
ncbi:UNVERIFIED_CONTAM: hypothetical protein FKN15_073325 [Acipenser sinensis]